jgi:integration host factor subunit beta
MTKQPTLTKADLIEEVLKVAELPRKESETIVETIFESIIDALQKGDKIEIRGFGSFRTRQRRGRIGRNPKTGEKVEVPAKKIPFFKPSKELKDFVNTSATAIGEAAQKSKKVEVQEKNAPREVGAFVFSDISYQGSEIRKLRPGRRYRF